MKKIFLVLIMMICISCERHTQSGFVSGKSLGQVVNLKGSDVLFASLSSDDYFYLKQELATGEYDLNSPNERGNLLLNEAIKLDRALITMLLVENGADPSQVDDKEISAFDLISTNENNDDWQEIIIGNSPSVDFLNKQLNDLIADAAVDKQDDVIKKLELYLEMGANVNSQNLRGFTLLMNASLKGLPQVVTFLCHHPEIDFDVKFRRMNVVGLVKRQMRRNPALKEILIILQKYID